MKYDAEEIAKWMECDDGLKFLPSIGFYDDSDPSTGSSTGSGGATTVVYDISLPDRLRFVLESDSQSNASYYKDSEIVWTSL